MCFLNKKHKRNQKLRLKNQAQWDRYSLYIFCMLMRIRNPHNFVTWAMCNAASEYGHGGANLAVFFGLAVAQTTLLRRLSNLNKSHTFTWRTVFTLSMIWFIVATFDNSQVIRQKKYQSGGRSSTVTLVTSRMFIKSFIPFGLLLFVFPTEKPELTYANQAIPSPYGMPAYESEDKITAKSYTNPSFKKKLQETNVDGKRVKRYAELVQISHMVNRLRRILPLWSTKFKSHIKNLSMV